MQLKGSKTEGNLKAAFAGESQANRRYLYFAAKADVDRLPGRFQRARRVNAGDHWPDQAYIRLAQLERGNVDDLTAGEQDVEGLAALRGLDGAQPCRKIDGVAHADYSALMFAAAITSLGTPRI